MNPTTHWWRWLGESMGAKFDAEIMAEQRDHCEACNGRGFHWVGLTMLRCARCLGAGWYPR